MESRGTSSPGNPLAVWTVDEVAEFLRVTTKTVYSLASRGEIASFRVGRVLRFRNIDVLQFAAGQARPTTPPESGRS